MTGVTMTATFNVDTALAGLMRAEQLLRHKQPLLRQIGVLMVHSTQQRFNGGRDPTGAAWKPLSAAYASVKTGSHILVGMGMSGGLQGSITSEAGATSVQWGSNKVYAAIHQFGGVIKPKNATRLAFRLGGAMVFAKSVTIPARPYLGISHDDEAEIGALIARRFGQALGAL